MARTERKYMGHYVDANFSVNYSETDYVRLGEDLEEYNRELNPDVEISKNILGNQSVRHNGYEVQASVEPYYYGYDDALSEKLMDIAMDLSTGDTVKTSVVDVLMKPNPNSNPPVTVIKAWRQDAYVVPSSIGGDTSGIQIPFTIYAAGNPVKGTFDLSTNKFTPEGSSSGEDLKSLSD